MSAQPAETVGLDRATYLSTFVPGVVLLTGVGAILMLIPGVAPSVLGLWWSVAGLPGASVLIIVGGGAVALGLGYTNYWLSRRLYDRRDLSSPRVQALDPARMLEILPYWAYGPYASSFYDELRKQIDALMGTVQQLAVLSNPGAPSQQTVRDPLDVTADLMYAWVRCHSAGLSDPPHRTVERWRERSDASIAFSTAFPISLFLIAVGGQVQLVASYGWPTLFLLLPVVALALARPIHRWFVFRAVGEWATGQNVMSRAFWALHKAKP